MANSNITTTGDGSTTIFSFPFGYIDRSHISVLVDGTPVTFSFTTSNTVEVVPAPALGAIIRVQRTTPQSPVVDFNDGETLTESDLDKVSLQSLYLAQENEDSLTSLLSENTLGQLDGEGRRIVNIEDPVAPQDAVTKNYVDNGVDSGVAQAQTAATNAANSAASASASQAASSASEAAASASETAAATSETNAAASAAAASTSETNAAASEAAASTSETNAAASETAAAASAAAASTSETNAAASEAAAATSETNAAASEAAAAASATQAASSTSWLNISTWSVRETVGGDLIFSTGGVDRMKLSPTGDLIVTGEITAFGSI